MTDGALVYYRKIRMIDEGISGFTRIWQLRDIILERYKSLE